MTRSVDETISVRQLADGTTLISEHRPDREVQAIEIRVGAGFGDDPQDAPGVAHLMEHLALRRADGRGPDDARTGRSDLQGLHPLAFTTRDFTAFRVVATRGDAGAAVHGLHRLIRDPDFDSQAVRAELRIIAAERIAQTADPGRRLAELAEGTIFGFAPPAVAQAIDLSPLAARSFWAANYGPSNVVIATSGPVQDLGSAYSGRPIDPRPAGSPAAAAAEYAAPNGTEAITAQVYLEACEERTSQTHVVRAFPVAGASPRERAVANVLASALGGGFESFLVRKLRSELNLSYSPRAFFTGYGSAGMITLCATATTPEIGKVRTVLSTAMSALTRDPALPATVERARRFLRHGTLIAFDDLAKRAAALASAWEQGYTFSAHRVMQAIDDVTAADIHDLAGRLASLPTVEVVPGGEMNEGEEHGDRTP